MSRDITNHADIIDIRDLIERFEEMDEERHALEEEIRAAQEEVNEQEDEDCELARKLKLCKDNLEEWDADEGDEFLSTQTLLGDLESRGGDHQWRGDWYPVSLIRESHFTEAMRELVSDIGDLPKNIPSYIEIDWEKTAGNLQRDYSSVEYGNVTYYYR